MTAIPSGTKFLGIAASVDTTEKRSKLNNSYQEYYTIQDIAGAAATTTAIVNISSAQILAMGTTPVELLPAPGVGKYYDIEKVILEYNYNSVGYSNAPQPMPSMGNFYQEISVSFLSSASNDVVIINDFGRDPQGIYERYIINQKLELGDYNGANPTLGDGTLRVIITYTVRTFGA